MEQREEKSRPRRSNDLGPTGEVVSRNLARLRAARGLSTRQLAAVLKDMGRVIPASGISKIETGARRVDADDLVALAAALRVSPSTLLLPPTTTGDIEVTGVGTVPARTAWRWMEGRRPLAAEGDLTAVIADFIANARPDGMRTFDWDLGTPEERELAAAMGRMSGMRVRELEGGRGYAYGEHPSNETEGELGG